jgi:hypothetical protein
MKLTVRRLVGIGGALVALLLGIAWLLWPAAPDPKVAGVDEPEQAEKAKKPVGGGVDITEPRKEGDVLERLGIDPEITPHCAVINQWHDRHVPMWVILDNMDAGAMMFHEIELECLTTSPIPPGILTWAENHIDHRTNALLAEGGE